jgi:hypothetical protein
MPPPTNIGRILKFRADPLEKTLEGWLRYRVARLGGIAYKFTSPGSVSVPDRIVLFPQGVIFFVELKRLGKKLTPKQAVEHEKIRGLGFNVYTCDSKESLTAVLDKELSNLF